MIKLNCVGDICPMPIIKTKKILETIDSKETLKIEVDNIEAKENIIKYIKSKGYEYKRYEKGNYFIEVVKSGDIFEKEEIKKDGIIVISSDEMGEGNRELGVALLKSYVYTLTELEKKPSVIILYNSGVKLSVKSSKSIEDLKMLEENGVKILICGACLNFYNILEEVVVGEVTNMYEIATITNNAKVFKV